MILANASKWKSRLKEVLKPVPAVAIPYRWIRAFRTERIFTEIVGGNGWDANAGHSYPMHDEPDSHDDREIAASSQRWEPVGPSRYSDDRERKRLV